MYNIGRGPPVGVLGFKMPGRLAMPHFARGPTLCRLLLPSTSGPLSPCAMCPCAYVYKKYARAAWVRARVYRRAQATCIRALVYKNFRARVLPAAELHTRVLAARLLVYNIRMDFNMSVEKLMRQIEQLQEMLEGAPTHIWRSPRVYGNPVAWLRSERFKRLQQTIGGR